MSHVWKSALNAGLAPALSDMNRSIDVDFRLWPQDLRGTHAHVRMLARCGLVPQELCDRVESELERLSGELAEGAIVPQDCDEDVHGFVERVLIERIGPEAANIHIARSRNEQILLDVKLFLIDETRAAIAGIDACIDSLGRLATRSGEQLMPAYTHLRRAQPIFVAQYWLAHAQLWEHTRDRFQTYLEWLREECPMGSGAINGTTLPTDPAWEARELGFAGAARSPLATVSSRAPLVEFMAIAVHWLLETSRLAEDLINWSTDEFGYVTLAPHTTTGSSMMPQKRNPDILELVRGQAAVAMGHYMGMLTMLKGLPMGYMKDLQEDKPALFATVEILRSVSQALPIVLDGISLVPERLAESVADPALLATDVMEWLIVTGMPLRQAHKEVAGVIAEAARTGVSLSAAMRARWPELPDAALSPQASCAVRAAHGRWKKS